MSKMKKTTYPLRPHHGMCLAFFEGKGYSDGFTAHMGAMLKLFEDENPEIELVCHTDSICSACPNNAPKAAGEDQCTSVEKVSRYDRMVLDMAGLTARQRLRYNAFRALVEERILRAGLRREICGGCQWADICDRKEKEREGHV